MFTREIPMPLSLLFLLLALPSRALPSPVLLLILHFRPRAPSSVAGVELSQAPRWVASPLPSAWNPRAPFLPCPLLPPSFSCLHAPRSATPSPNPTNPELTNPYAWLTRNSSTGKVDFGEGPAEHPASSMHARVLGLKVVEPCAKNRGDCDLWVFKFSFNPVSLHAYSLNSRWVNL